MKTLNRFIVVGLIFTVGCGPDSGRGRDGAGRGDGGEEPDLSPNPIDDGGIFMPPADGMLVVEDPKTCAEAAMNRSYIGCDYWPTVTSNSVWSVFDFAVVVANAGDMPADITVTGPGTNKMVTVAPNAVEKIYLPWVPNLKGGDADECGNPKPLTATVKELKGAFHLVSTRPVIVSQFNALEFKGQGGEPGKVWTSCPGSSKDCIHPLFGNQGKVGCFSFSNDASLLMPSTAMTGNYRVTGIPSLGGPLGQNGIGGYFVVTATQDNTTVKIKVSSTGNVMSGGGMSNMMPGGTATFTLDAGDVMEVLGKGADGVDLSGSLVQADKPVQVLSGIAAFVNPADKPASDHVEEVVFPVETLGKYYVVMAPTGPKGARVGQSVRLYGNVDGTALSFNPAIPGAPATLAAGQVVDLGIVDTDFIVTGDHEFAVTTIMQGGSVVDPQGMFSTTPSKGDPSLSLVVAAEQYRLKYVFLAPDDYDVNYADVVAPMGAQLKLDGVAVTATATQIGSSGYGAFRLQLGAGAAGSHSLESDKPVGIQVLGYGAYTSYQYPGGVNLLTIAPSPPIF